MNTKHTPESSDEPDMKDVALFLVGLIFTLAGCFGLHFLHIEEYQAMIACLLLLAGLVVLLDKDF